jgi:hypothetical protein
VNSYQAEALTNVLRYHICRSSHPEDRKLPITELKWDARTVTHPLLVPMAARITKYLNKYVRTGLCLIYISSFLFLEPSVSQKNAKKQCAVLPGGNTSYFNLPSDIGFTLFTPIKGRIYSLTVYIYKAETCTKILRYNTCMSSYPGDRKWTKIEQ